MFVDLLRVSRIASFAVVLAITLGVVQQVPAQTEGGEEKPPEAQEANEKAKEKDLFEVPQTDDVAELLKYIEDVRASRPPRPRGPAEYREYVKYLRNAPDAIAKAAEKVLKLEKDPKSAEYQAASLFLLETKVMGFAIADEEGRKQMYEDVLAHMKKYGVGQTEFGVAYGIAQALEEIDTKLAINAYNEFAKVIKSGDDEEIRDLAIHFEGPARRLGLVGNKMDVFGKTLEGKKFNWKKYRGKVVLVDFWATWCGPCLEELPNLKEAYEKYHKQGFEVVGVNLDDRRFAVERFLSRNDLPWVQLHQEEDGNALAEHYGINAIPFMALVGRDGKVISTEARGRRLQQQLEEIFGPAKSSE